MSFTRYYRNGYKIGENVEYTGSGTEYTGGVWYRGHQFYPTVAFATAASPPEDAGEILVAKSDPTYTKISAMRYDGIFGDFADNKIPYGSIIIEADINGICGDTWSTAAQHWHRCNKSWTADDTWNTFFFEGATQNSWNNETYVDTTYYSEMPAALISNATSTDVTTVMRQFSAGTTNYGWVIVATSSSGGGIYAHTDATKTNRPQLVVTFDLPPGDLISDSGTPVVTRWDDHWQAVPY